MIYTVKSGDTLFKIAREYGVTIESIVEANGLSRPNDLVIGQSLFIPTQSNLTTYRVVAGDTMYLISQRLGIPLNDLIVANPQITNPNVINIGDIINIPSGKKAIEVNGYAIANINTTTLERTLPYLTYISIFSYQAKQDGNLFILYEDDIIERARNMSVAPVMVVTNIAENGGFDSDIASRILNNENITNTLINNIISRVVDKNYYGVDIDFEYLYPRDRVAYLNFLRKLKTELVKINKKLSVAVAPKYRDEQSGILYEAHDYRGIGEIADRVIIMTYEWGYTYGEPMAVSPLMEVDAVLRYAVTRIPPEKILMGMPNYGYAWNIPYEQGTPATAITNSRALELAIENGATINFDERAQAPYFNYTGDNGRNKVVWFDDARSISARLELVNKYNLAGVSYWTINNFYAVNWAVLNSKFDVVKINY
ncbi:MAG: LysM peptidoglycan-binding domain-containing protein [Clostridiales bacterium]|nr:LysM peptidoglycan-binding domain-containing protein [Clostridiales bacterium]